MKKKAVIIISLLLFFGFGSGITYSIFHSNASLSFTDQDVAKFVFNGQTSDNLEFNLVDLKPNDVKEYQFSVTNKILENISSVSIDYKMILKTYHLIPVKIELYKEGINDPILDCNEETYAYTEQHELICNSPIQTMNYGSEQTDNYTLDNYTLKITFPNEYNDEKYANLTDYIDLEIQSSQKLG